MVNAISSTHASQASEAVKSASNPKTQQEQQPKTQQPSDTVTLKSTGDANQTGNNQ
ncbi:MAG: hypothetical protein ABSA78_13575 [Candidatus Sulfotelmatobacter sp.]|jgi:hypothetical protein